MHVVEQKVINDYLKFEIGQLLIYLNYFSQNNLMINFEIKKLSIPYVFPILPTFSFKNQNIYNNKKINK